MALLRDRLALGAAAAGLVRAGGRARAAELRDRLCFLPAGAAINPATARLALWRRAGSTRLRGGGLARLLAEVGDGAVDGGGDGADLAAVVDGSGDCAHHGDPATDSMSIRPPVPPRSGHRFHEDPATLA